jgi:flagellar hook-length control protein FliK
MTPPTIPAIAPEPAVTSTGATPEQAEGSADGFATVLGEFSGTSDSSEGEGTAGPEAGPAGAPVDASASAPVAAEAAAQPAQVTVPPVAVAAPPPQAGGEDTAVPSAAVAAETVVPTPTARVAPTPPVTVEPAPEGHVASEAQPTDTGAPGPSAAQTAAAVSIEVEAAPDTTAAPAPNGSAPAALPTEAGTEDQPDEQGQGVAKGRPDHARAHEIPGQAKDPGTPAGRPFADTTGPAGDTPDQPASEPSADATPAPAPQRSTPDAAAGPRHAGVPADEQATAAARTDSGAVPATAPTYDATAGADPADTHIRRGHEAGPTRAHVALSDLAAEAGASIRLATRGGLSSAQIVLTPPELGQVEIRLRYRGGAVVAELTADSAQAAQTLARSSAELRRTLEDQGIVVLSLDVRQAGPEARSDNSQGRDHDPSGSGGPLGGRQEGDGEEVSAVRPTLAPSRPAGIQIDVLA